MPVGGRPPNNEDSAIAASDLTPGQPPDRQHASVPPSARRRFEVAIEAYVRLSFNDEIELTGYIGDETLTALSKSTRRTISVTGDVGGMAMRLSVKRLHLRNLPVSGDVLGQPLSGHITTKDGSLVYSGQAGEEPLHYRLDGRGVCTNHEHDLGLRIQAQAFHSEIVGSVGRIPDAVMVALLLPVRLVRIEDVYG